MTLGKIGARDMMYRWRNPYVTDGLVAMWDGEWNAGGGVHDASATTWVDISGNSRDATLSGTYLWGSNYWHVESVSGRGLATWPAQNLGNSQTIEFVISVSRATTFGRIIAEGQSVASPVARTTSLYCYGFGIDKNRPLTDHHLFYSTHIHQIVHPSGGPMYYYVDGILAWTESGATSNSTGTTNGYFANRSNLDKGIDADYFTMRRYDRALSVQELSANYAIDKARFNLP